MKMNKYVKEFLHRGLLFGGFGSLITAIVFVCVPDVTLTGYEAFTAVLSTYLLAFVHAGVSVFNQIDHWPLPKSLLCHFLALYAVYVTCYIINGWIPFHWPVVGVFTLAFAALYFVIWTIVYVCVRATQKRLNQQMNKDA